MRGRELRPRDTGRYLVWIVRTDGRMTSTTLNHTSHAEREAAVYASWKAAVAKGDRAEIDRRWADLVNVIKDRPAEVVKAMEEAKGLR